MNPALDFLTAPPVLFTITAVLFLVLVRSPWPWTRLGGGLLAAAAVAALVSGLGDPTIRALFASSERLPILGLVLGSCVACWLALRQARQAATAPDDYEEPAWRGVTRAELLLGALTILGVAGVAFAVGAPLGEMADPSRPAAATAAPWFLLGLLSLSAYFDPWVPTWLLPILTVTGLLVLPYLDPPAEGPGSEFEERRDVVYFVLFVWFLLALLPMVNAAGIWQEDLAEGGPAAASAFSEVIWSTVRDVPPHQVWLRELPVLLILGVYFVVLPWQLPRFKPTRALLGRYVKRLGSRRYYLAMVIMQLWMLVPLKMYGRWLFGIGYFVYLPELGFNF